MLNKAIFLLLVPLALIGQPVKRLEPGKMYESGETLFAPRYGFTAMVPAGWTGLLPRESEVFLMSSETTAAEIFVFAREQGEMTAMKKAWETGFDLDEHLRLRATAAKIQDGTLSSEIVAVGPFVDKSKRGYAIARCGDYGTCVICLAMMPAANYADIRKVTDEFISSAAFSKPSSASPYDDFEWKNFLSGKMLNTYAILEDGSKQTKIELCADGTFSATVTKKGILKNQNPQYRGKLAGTWSAAGTGEKGTLHLEFKKKLPALDVPLLIREEKVYANEERYFVASSERCK